MKKGTEGVNKSPSFVKGPIGNSIAVITVISLCWYLINYLLTNSQFHVFFTKTVLPFVLNYVHHDEKVPYAFVFVAMLYAALSKIPVNIAQASEGRGYDNNKPRDQQTRLIGWGARACAAHYNTFEALIILLSAVLTAVQCKVELLALQKLLFVWVAARGAYHLAYVFNLPTLRSLVYMIAMSCVMKLFALALF